MLCSATHAHRYIDARVRLHRAHQCLCKRVSSRTLGATGASVCIVVCTRQLDCLCKRVAARTLGASGATAFECCARAQQSACPLRKLQFAKRRVHKAALQSCLCKRVLDRLHRAHQCLCKRVAARTLGASGATAFECYAREALHRFACPFTQGSACKRCLCKRVTLRTLGAKGAAVCTEHFSACANV